MYSYGSPHMAAQKQGDQLERTFSSYVRIQDVVLKTYLGRWTIGRSGERGSGISVLPARYDDDDDLIKSTWMKDCCLLTHTHTYTHTHTHTYTHLPYIYIYIYIVRRNGFVNKSFLKVFCKGIFIKFLKALICYKRLSFKRIWDLSYLKFV